MLFIPELSKLYFDTKNEWDIMLPPNSDNVLIKTDILSNVSHGFKCQGVQASKSLFYTSPFFFKLNTPTVLPANYLVFNGFYKANVSKCILSMVKADEDNNTFISEFSPTIVLPFLKSLVLDKVLEFILVDSNDQQVTIENNSQLFISINIKRV
jgi:hypothetical protein